MAFKHGSSATLTMAGSALTGYANNVTLSNTADTAETTVFGLANKTYIAGLRDATMSFDGFYDPTSSTGSMAIVEAAMAGGTAVAMVYKPGGTATGQLSYTFNGIVTGYDLGSNLDGAVTVSGSIQVSGAITIATL